MMGHTPFEKVVYAKPGKVGEIVERLKLHRLLTKDGEQHAQAICDLAAECIARHMGRVGPSYAHELASTLLASNYTNARAKALHKFPAVGIAYKRSDIEALLAGEE